VTDAEPSCRLYAVVEAGDASHERLAAALTVADVASVLIIPGGGGILDAKGAQPLVELAQRANVAALIAGHAQLARTLRADGVHLDAVGGLAAYEEARSLLGSRAIVGADPGISRHDAMAFAEAGADYVAFGAPAHLNDRDKARARRDELVEWWAEIFQIPCVAFDVETPEEAAHLARTGADFIAVRLARETPAVAGERLAAIADALRLSEAA
jgi:thiamine-phosphate pyrophosphorylase